MKLLTLKEASKLIDGLTVFRIRTLCRERKIKYHKFGNKFMVLEKDLLDYFTVKNFTDGG